ncbi:MAG: redox-sensing transcriptional repressor Rex [Acutalibacteraceae bacterium]|nr:redox-sensing transcriptional repressor Rex [Acutalibacteraceae bacterium]
MCKNGVSKATLGRIPMYLDLLRDLPEERYEHISATTIARKLSLGEVLVRKDLASISGAGKPKLGYLTSELIENLENSLGCNNYALAVLVGAGKLGKALLDYDEFEKFGIKIAAAFDSNDKEISITGKIKVKPINEFEDFCKSRNIQLGIITVGAGSAQAVCDKMVECGITGILNFAPCSPHVPDGVVIQNENLALSLAHLKNQINK